jgi:hypothetical protein
MAAELSRHSHNVNTKMRKAVGPDGDVLFRIGLPLPENSEILKTFLRVSFFSAQEQVTTPCVFSSTA